MVWKLDRLGRSLPHLIEIVTGLKAAGVGFRSLTEQMDTGTPHGELLFHLFGALAQYERALTQERIRAGLAAARRRGRAGGRRGRSMRRSWRRSGRRWRSVQVKLLCVGPLGFLAVPYTIRWSGWGMWSWVKINRIR